MIDESDLAIIPLWFVGGALAQSPARDCFLIGFLILLVFQLLMHVLELVLLSTKIVVLGLKMLLMFFFLVCLSLVVCVRDMCS